MNTPTRPRSILLVEDDENDVFFFQRAYRKSGVLHPLHVVRDGLEAIQYLGGEGEYADRLKHPLPTLIVLDLNMPRRNGIEVLQWLRRQAGLASIRVVVLTSSSCKQDMEVAFELGVKSYVLKSADPERLLTLVRELAASWLLDEAESPAQP